MTSSRSGRAVRWSAPLAVIAVVAAISVLVPALTAQAKPNLPPMTAADLLAKAQRAKVDALSGTVRLTTRLGLPSLGAFGGRGGVLTDLLSGSHDARVWRDGPESLAWQRAGKSYYVGSIKFQDRLTYDFSKHPWGLAALVIVLVALLVWLTNRLLGRMEAKRTTARQAPE